MIDGVYLAYIDVIIPFDQDVLASVPAYGTNPGTDHVKEDLTDAEKAVILEVVKTPDITYNQLSAVTGISRRSVSRAIASLVDKGYIQRVGNNKTGLWKVMQ